MFDEDVRDNGCVIYWILGEIIFFLLFFMIDKYIGDILVKGDLICISGEYFEFEIVCEDYGELFLLLKVNLIFFVLDVVNNFLMIDVNILFGGGGWISDNLMVLVLEFLEMGIVVVFLSVIDRDIDDNGNVFCFVFGWEFEF